jgi:Tol biopolymer transport system component
MNLSDLMNDLADHTIEPDRLPAPEVVRRAGDFKRVTRRRRAALVAAAAVAVAAATGAVLSNRGGEERLLPAPPSGLPDRVTVFDESGDVSFVADDGSRQTIPARNVDRFALSPDGGQIAYIAGINTDRGGSLWIADADGGNRDRLPAPCAGCQAGFGVTWSHDGTRLAYVAWTPGKRPAQLRIRTVSTGQEQVTRMPAGLEPRGPKFSPDDRSLAINVSTDTGEYVATLNLAEGMSSLTRLSDTYSQVQAPTWSADGQTIYFTATTSGENTNDVTASIDLFAIDANGSGFRQITHAEAGERFFGVVPYEDQFLISRAVGDDAWTVGWLSGDGSSFTPMKGPDGKTVLGSGAQLQP